MITSQPDRLPRCPWSGQDPLYLAYHDQEWGDPEYDDRALYEKLVLDGFQAGLSWIIILRKRDNFRRAFDAFEPANIARYTPKKVAREMSTATSRRSSAAAARTSSTPPRSSARSCSYQRVGRSVYSPPIEP